MKNVKKVISLLLVALIIGSLCVTNVSAFNWECPFCDGTETGEHCETCGNSTCSNCGLCYCTSIGSIADDINNQDYPFGFDFMQMEWSKYSEIENANSNDEHNVEVYVTKGSTYTITVPKTVILSGTNGKGTYTVKVTGDLSGSEYIKVIPDSSFALEQTGKTSITATVDQDKVKWAYSNLNVDGTGEITATGLSAGSWSGSFKFNISRGEDQTTLEGDGQTYHRMAPSALSFRSDEPLDEFQQVLINGEPLDETAYTLTEGSTIVTLNIDYLDTLDVDNYEITVVSDNGSPSADFGVVTTNLNDYGFYYNQPYTTYFDDWGQDVVFFMREDGTMDIMLISITMEVLHGTYTINDTEMLVHLEDGTDFHCNLLVDEQAIYCTELNETFVIDAEKIAYDDEYLYVYDENFGGYSARAMNKNKTIYKPIKDNILDIDVVSIEGAFADCVNMVEAPVIPKTILNIGDAYNGCISLKTAPTIPNSVIGMLGTFNGCISLTQAPVIPENVIDLSCAFYHCHSLTGNIEINTNKINCNSGNAYGGCFEDTKLPINITGTASNEIKAVLASTAENGNVTY